MLQTPSFKAHLQPVVVQPDKVFLISEFTQRVVRGRSSLRVIELIDGIRTTDDIVAALSPQVSMRQIYYVLALLEKHGYIEEARSELPRSTLAYWHSLGIDSRQVVERLTSLSVQVRTVGEVTAQPLLDLLAASGVRLLDAAEADLWVVLADDYLRDELGAINQAALALGKPWLLVRPNGIEVWIGPLFRPELTGCWVCLQERMRMNRATEGYLRRTTGHTLLFPPQAALPTSYQVAWSIAAQEICSWIVTGESVLEGKIASFHTKHLQTSEHVLVRRPRCTVCGEMAGSQQLIQPVVLAEHSETQVADGGYRGVAPEETVETYKHLISPICGVITELVRVSRKDDYTGHVYVSGSNQAMGYRTYSILRHNLRSFNCGKGASDIQARASAIGEAIERFSGCFQGYEPTLFGSMCDLVEKTVDPRLCMLYSEHQYRDRAIWNGNDNPFEYVPQPFDPQMEISWSPLWSLTRGEVCYLPTSYCYYNFQDRVKYHFCSADSNGCASGNTLEEAILQGFLELVERDCIAIWWYNRLKRPAVDLASFGDPYIDKLQEYYHKQRREIWVLDVSNDLGIATFVALSRRVDQPAEMIMFGAGCHLDPQIALLRALTELNQMLVGVDNQHVVDDGNVEDTATRQWLEQATLAGEPYLAPHPALPARRKQDIPDLGRTHLRDAIMLCQSLVEQRGMELLVLDQTRPDIGMPVVRVVVPGLRFFWRRLAPGRLYDVPVQLGWLTEPLREDQLNPKTIFI